MTDYLLDTSVIARQHRSAVQDRLKALGSHRHHVCTPVMLELGLTARNGDEHATLMDDLRHTYTVVAPSAWVHERALEIQGALATRGQHRSARLSDLLIAATAEQHGMTMLHYDRDFDTVAAVTGQLCQWIVPAGSVD